MPQRSILFETRNGLLLSLPPDVLADLMPHFETVALPLRHFIALQEW